MGIKPYVLMAALLSSLLWQPAMIAEAVPADVPPVPSSPSDGSRIFQSVEAAVDRIRTHIVNGRGTEISTSVLQYSFADLEPTLPDSSGALTLSPCQVTINNSMNFNAKKVSFVLTAYAVWANGTLQRYYYKNEKDQMVPVSTDTIERFQSGLAQCFKSAIDGGFTTLHILSHLNIIENNLGNRALWRNVVKFDPLARAGANDSSTGFTYSDVLLQPAAEALNAVVTEDIVVQFSVAGEQGLSVWGYPRAYMQIMQDMKAITTRGLNTNNHLFGIAWNYDKICGCVEPEERDPILYNQTYPDRMVTFKNKWGYSGIDLAGVKELIASSDFMGLSSYAPLPAVITPDAMEVAISTAAYEMSFFGIDIKKFSQTKPIIYSEQGLGGSRDNGSVAPDLDWVRKHPYTGTPPSYSPQLDPWRVPEFKEYRQQLYKMMSYWAAVGGGPQYNIDSVYVWNSGSWDVQGVHPKSTNSQGTYSDDVIKTWITAANGAVNNRPAGSTSV